MEQWINGYGSTFVWTPRFVNLTCSYYLTHLSMWALADFNTMELHSQYTHNHLLVGQGSNKAPDCLLLKAASKSRPLNYG